MDIEILEQANTSSSSNKNNSEKNESNSSKNSLNNVKDNNIDEYDNNVLNSKVKNKTQFKKFEVLKAINNTNDMPNKPKKKGRHNKTGLPCFEPGHGKNTIDDVHDKIINQCKKSLDGATEEMFKEIGASPIPCKINIKIKKNIRSYIDFGNTTIFDIYCKSFPKKSNKKRKLEKMKGNINRFFYCCFI